MEAHTKEGKVLTLSAPNSKKNQASFATYKFDGCLVGAYGKMDPNSFQIVTLGFIYDKSDIKPKSKEGVEEQLLKYSSVAQTTINLSKLNEFNASLTKPIEKIKVCSVSLSSSEHLNSITLWSSSETTGLLGTALSFETCATF